MKLSVRTRYAIRLLLDLASHVDSPPRNASQLSKNSDVPEHYIVQIMAPLRAAGMIKSIRGAGGGHTLLKTPAEITLGDIFRATEGHTKLTECCADPKGCPRAAKCPMRPIWDQASKALEDTLDSHTLADLLAD